MSRWHRVTSDEVWHLYEGGPLEVLELDADRHCAHATSAGRGLGDARVHRRRRLLAGRSSARDYALVGCTVGPGFDFADFTLLADEPASAARVRRSGRNSHHSSDAHARTGTSRLGSHRLDNTRELRDSRANGSRRHGAEAEQQRIGAMACAEVIR